MQTLEYTYVDKTDWLDGPWNNEPDKRQWQDESTGLPCLIVRGPVGALCGYVGVSADHPLFEKSYNFAMGYDENWESTTGYRVEVHGGLTFDGFCVEDEKEHGICHIVEPGEPDRVWWLGFDCSHSGDLAPSMTKMYREQGLARSFSETYRDFAYVEQEVTDLASQLADCAAQ